MVWQIKVSINTFDEAFIIWKTKLLTSLVSVLINQNIIYRRRAGQYDKLEAQVDGARFGLEIDPPNFIFHTTKDKNWLVFQWAKESVIHWQTSLICHPLEGILYWFVINVQAKSIFIFNIISSSSCSAQIQSIAFHIKGK